MATYKDVSRDRVREILREARDKMNDNGKHWIRGDYFKRIRGRGNCYCSIGAIHSVTRKKHEREAAYLALCERGVGSSTRNSYGTINPYTAESNIIRWNDNFNRTWSDVNKAFRKAVRNLR